MEITKSHIENTRRTAKDRGINPTSEQIRGAIILHYQNNDGAEFDTRDIPEIVNILLRQQPPQPLVIPKGDIIQPPKLEGASELTHSQKQTLIQQVASEIEVTLPTDQLKIINQQMNWAISDRASLKLEIRDAIIRWIDYHVEQDRFETNQIMQEVESHLVSSLEQNNTVFESGVQGFSQRISEARDKFRSTKADLLSLFQVPN